MELAKENINDCYTRGEFLDTNLQSEILESITNNTPSDINALAMKYDVSAKEVSDLESKCRIDAAANFHNTSKEFDEISTLIGKHPKSALFFDWCKCEDSALSMTKKHRKLSDKGIDRNTLIDKLSDWIIEHHTPVKQLERFKKKKSILNKHNFKEYVSKNMPFPIKSFKTQKGNLGEIILAEYLKSSSGLELLIYKLSFNPNIEQSMKGDDVLLFDKNDIKNKIIMGESKYRTTPDKTVVEDIMKALTKDNLPISLSFVRDRLDDLEENDIANEIDALISEIHKKNIPIVYAGFLHSNHNAAKTIETHLNTDNENLVVISYGEQNPENLIRESFDKAIEKITSQNDH